MCYDYDVVIRITEDKQTVTELNHEQSIKSPYANLSKRFFWNSGVVQQSPFNVKGIYIKKWDIKPEWKIATAGSCFAQHISTHLRNNGFNLIDLEPPPSGLPVNLHKKFGFSTYSARYGNIYTIRQLLQLAQEVTGSHKPGEIAWKTNDKFYDALRPNIEPDGLDSQEEVRTHRDYHLSRVKEMFQSMDLFIFTFGMTEAWIHKKTGTVFPTAPGTIAGSFHPDIYEFKNFEFNEVIKDFIAFQKIITRMRGGKAMPHFLLTVSPVSLTATASQKHVLQATTYSKSLLRTVAGQLSATHEYIDYFPSYEIIINQAARGAFYENNLRSVRPEGVATAMKVFFGQHVIDLINKQKYFSEVVGGVEESCSSKINEDDVECEDALLEAFLK